MDLVCTPMHSGIFQGRKEGNLMARIDSAYDYYVSTYGNQKASRYDSHKKSDLRKLYNHIVKSNKESPLYKLSNVEDAKRYAIDIKENAKAIQNVVASLSDRYGGFADSFQKKVAVSSDEETVEVKYVGDGNETNQTEQFDIQINRLAMPQVNEGHYLKKDALFLTPGTYSFDLNTNTSSYEFQYNVNSGDTNYDVMQKLSNLVNNSNLGLTAEIKENAEGLYALSLTSHQTGLSQEESYLFSITPGTSPESIKAMDVLGINNVSSPASNSDFLLNGAPQTSLSNTFTINNAFELTLKRTSPDSQPSKIGFKANTDAVADNIQTLVDAYNGMLHTAKNYSQSHPSQANRLLSDMNSLSKGHKSELEAIGLMVSEDGFLSIDRDLLADAITPEHADHTFKTLSNLKDMIGAKAESATINPMRYVDKVVVAYKNPGRNFAAPYISSIYSGLMLDNYI